MVSLERIDCGRETSFLVGCCLETLGYEEDEGFGTPNKLYPLFIIHMFTCSLLMISPYISCMLLFQLIFHIIFTSWLTFTIYQSHFYNYTGINNFVDLTWSQQRLHFCTWKCRDAVEPNCNPQSAQQRLGGCL